MTVQNFKILFPKFTDALTSLSPNSSDKSVGSGCVVPGMRAVWFITWSHGHRKTFHLQIHFTAPRTDEMTAGPQPRSARHFRRQWDHPDVLRPTPGLQPLPASNALLDFTKQPPLSKTIALNVFISSFERKDPAFGSLAIAA